MKLKQFDLSQAIC